MRSTISASFGVSHFPRSIWLPSWIVGRIVFQYIEIPGSVQVRFYTLVISGDAWDTLYGWSTVTNCCLMSYIPLSRIPVVLPLFLLLPVWSHALFTCLSTMMISPPWQNQQCFQNSLLRVSMVPFSSILTAPLPSVSVMFVLIQNSGSSPSFWIRIAFCAGGWASNRILGHIYPLRLPKSWELFLLFYTLAQYHALPASDDLTFHYLAWTFDRVTECSASIRLYLARFSTQNCLHGRTDPVDTPLLKEVRAWYRSMDSTGQDGSLVRSAPISAYVSLEDPITRSLPTTWSSSLASVPRPCAFKFSITPTLCYTFVTIFSSWSCTTGNTS